MNARISMGHHALLVFASALGLALFGIVSEARAYDVSTHGILTDNAIRRSRFLTTPLFTKLGYAGSPFAEEFVARAADTFGAGDITTTASNLILLGVEHEDNIDDIKRVFNHFFDPQANGNGGRPLTVLGLRIGHTSPDWAIEDRGDVVSIAVAAAGDRGFSRGGVPQLYSYRDAQNALYASLTSSFESDRRLAFGKVLLSLGHVVHHIQDMAQPQHVRNEPHTPIQLRGRYYEAYTRLSLDPRLSALLSQNTYPGVIFDNVRQFWTDSAVAYRGMADFTARNYVSFATGFTSVRDELGETVGPNSVEFPLPDGSNFSGGRKRVQTQPVTLLFEDGRQLNFLRDYVIGDVFDRGSALTNAPGTIYRSRRLAASSLLNDSLLADTPFRVYTTDETVFEDGYPILLPRAVAFSAGLIDHFFRGVSSISFVRSVANPGSWLISSRDQALNGTFAVFAEDASGVRSPLPGAQFQLSIAAGGSRAISFPEPPQSTRRLVLAFRGQVGNEVPPDAGFMAVAGTVVDFTPPPVIQCGKSLSAFGGIEGLNAVFNVGNVAGPITLQFEAYSIPDTLIVSANGRVLYNSNGLISGTTTRRLAFDPAQLGGATTLAVRVGGQQEGTSWSLALSCPGKSLQPGEFPPTRNLAFTFGAVLTDVRGGCSAEVYIDGTFRLFANVSASAGPTRANIFLTQGSGHGIEYRNLRCEPNSQNILLGTQFIDNFGTVRLQNLNQTGVRLFDVR